MLVGDLLISARDQFPDPCGVMGAPAAPTLSATTGGTIPTGTVIAVVLTAANQWGETRASAEQLITVTSPNNAVTVTMPAQLPPGFTAINTYFGASAGNENQYISSSSGGTQTITSLTQGTAAFAPTVNGAYLPDTDGSDISAATLYRWFNEGLSEGARIVGGILDKTGMAAAINTMDYVVPNGPWVDIQDAWFDGYYLSNLRNRYIWNRNTTTGISCFEATQRYANDMTIRLYLAPDRAGGTTTLTANVAATDTTLDCTDLTNFLTGSPGLALVDSEVIAFGNSSVNNLIGCTRGWAGTTPAAHLSGATVQELNIQVSGHRMPNILPIGSSALTLPTPPAWGAVIIDYLLFRYAKFEQDKSGAQDCYNSLLGRLKEVNGAGYRKVSEIGQPSWMGPLYPGSPFGIIKQ